MSKKNFANQFAIMCLSMLLIFISFGCSEDEEESNPLTARENAAVGTWVLTKVTVTDLNGTYELTPQQANMSMILVANSDKTFSMNTTMNGETNNATGTWSLNGDFIVLSSERETELIPYTIEGNKFTITTYQQQGDILISAVLKFTKQ